MELREPPRPQSAPQADNLARLLLGVTLVGVFMLMGLAVLRSPSGSGDNAELRREVAAKLKAAGVLDEAAALYEGYLANDSEPAAERAKIAYSLGTTYLERGRYESALRWFYEAETLGAGELESEIGEKIVHSLEKLGRYHAAQTALASRASLEGNSREAVQRAEEDPVVAQLADGPIYRSQVEATFDRLPPEMARQLGDAEREQMLQQFVADELLYRKALKLELDDDPQVRSQIERLSKQAAVAAYVEREVLPKISVDEGDLANFFTANKERYAQAMGKKDASEVQLSEIRREVEAEYRQQKTRNALQSLIETELSSSEVKLFPERMKGTGNPGSSEGSGGTN